MNPTRDRTGPQFLLRSISWRCLLLAALLTSSAAADDFFWIDSFSGSFGTPSRWTPEGGPPNAGDAAIFAVGGAYTVSGGGTVSILQVSGGDVTFTGSISTDTQADGAALLFAGGTARVSGSVFSPLPMEIGQDKQSLPGNGTLRVFGGGSVQSTADFSNDDVAVSMAAQQTSIATLIIENTDSQFTADGGLNIAGAGVANVSVLTGGELVAVGDIPSSTPGIKIAVEQGGVGTLLVDGVNARVNNSLQMNVGHQGEGTFTVVNGGHITSSGTSTLPSLVLGFGETATGYGNVDNGGTLSTTGQFLIGGGGTGEFYVYDGGAVESNAIGAGAAVFLANLATSTGLATMYGGNWDVNGNFFIGGEGYGKVTVHAGATLDISHPDSLLTLGFQDGGLGELLVLGGQLVRPGGLTAITVGIGGRGRLEIHDGSDVADAKLRVAQIQSSSIDPSEVIVSGAGSSLTLSSEMAIGIEDAGQLRVQNGAAVHVLNAGSLAEAGGGASGIGEIFVTGVGSTLEIAAPLTLGRFGIGNLSVNSDGEASTGAATLGKQIGSEGNANVESGGVWNIDGDLVVGESGAGFVYLRPDGEVSLPSGKRVFLGLNPGATGVLNLYGNGMLLADTDVSVGQYGRGILVLHDGASYTTQGDFLLGNLSTAEGEIHLHTGSTFTASGDLTVGVAGDGYVTVDSTSTLDASNGSLTLGAIDGASGELYVDGGQLLRPADGFTRVGFGGRGKLEIFNGAVVNVAHMNVAQIPSSSADPSEVNVLGTGTVLNLSGAMGLGIEDRGDLNVRAGALVHVADAVVAGIAPVGNGQVLVTDADSKLQVDGIFVLAESGVAFGAVDADGTLETGPASIGRFDGGEGTMDVTFGGQWVVHGPLIVGDAGRGYLNLRQDGMVRIDSEDELILGNSPTGLGIFNLFGSGQLIVDNDVVIGQEGAGAFNLFEGAAYSSFGSVALGKFAGSSGNISVASGSTFTVNGDLTMAEDAAGTAGVHVEGVDSVLRAENVHVGGTTVAIGGLANLTAVSQSRVFVAGTLNLWGSGSVNVTGGGAVTIGDDTVPADHKFVRVNELGTLSGAGVVNGHVLNAGGSVAPGNSPGQLSINGNYLHGASASLNIEIGGLGVGTEFDRLSVSGVAAVVGDLVVALVGEFVPSPGQGFEFLTASGGVSGVFQDGDLPVLPGASWQLVYEADAVLLRVVTTGDYNNDGTVNAADYVVWRHMLNQEGLALAADGNGDKVVNRLDYEVWKAHYGETAFAAAAGFDGPYSVPEPTALSLLAFALACVAGGRRRR